MIPGPSEPYPEAVMALQKPILPHYGDQFLEIYNNLIKKLSELFGTKQHVHLYPGTGTAAIEMGLLSIIEKGDKVLFVNKGFFVDRFREIAEIHGAETHQVAPDEYGERVDLDELGYAIDVLKPKAVVVVHSETSTGVLEDLHAISKLIPEDTFYIVDFVSSFGALNLDCDNNRIDYGVGYPSKALGAVNGLTPFMVSERLWDYINPKMKKPKAFSIDLSVYRRYVEIWPNHPYPTSISPNLLNAMEAAVNRVLNEGLPNVVRRHYEISDYVKDWVFNNDLELIPKREVSSPTVTVFKLPEKIKANKVIEKMINEYNIYISSTWLIGMNGLRIGHMGATADMRYVIPTLHALKKVMETLS